MRLLICYKGVFIGRESNVVNFYVFCNKLKDVVRTGWGICGVDRFRVESIAEHIIYMVFKCLLLLCGLNIDMILIYQK